MNERSGTRQILFAPRSVAIIGASTDPTKYACLAQRYLRQHGYPGEIYPINARHREVFGQVAFPSVEAVGKPIDHAFIALPTGAVLDAVRSCARAGVGCVTILSNGFAESGPEGALLQQQVLKAARSGKVRILGPNSMGVINPLDHVALSVNEILSLPALPAGRIGVVSQSGSLMGAVLSRGQSRGMGFSRLVSVGNEADLDVAEIGDLLVDDPATDAILMFLETIRHPDRFAVMSARAFKSGKPVVAFRLGRSVLGAEIAASHTGAIAGRSQAFDAFLRECGVVCVRQFEAVLEIPLLLVGKKPVAGRRVAIMTTTGGGGGLVVDCLADHGVNCVPPDKAVVDRLANKGVRLGPSPLIDLTLTGANASTYGTVLEELLHSDHCDFVIAVAGSSAQFRPDRTVQPIVDAYAKRLGKPLAVFLAPQADQSLSLLQAHGIAAFRLPESCADAVRAFLEWRSPRTLPQIGSDVDLSRIENALAAGCERDLDAAEARAVFAALGIPQPQQVLVDAGCAPDKRSLVGIAFPVAVKIRSRNIAHKTEAGGVMLNLQSADEVERACRQISADVHRRRPDAQIDGVQIEAMETGLAEAIVGYRLDECAGPTVTVGVGGVLTEIYGDVAIRRAPVDRVTAEAMIAEVRGLASLRGFRGLPRGDIEALADAVVAVSNLAVIARPTVMEAEINPLLVKAKGDGVVALDAVVVCRRESATPLRSKSTRQG
jgi:acetate---CoA ligase (ADP-forming)